MKPGLRPAADVMRLPVLGSFFQTRLSFMRVLLRRMKKENWKFERALWDIDGDGGGTAIYRAQTPEREYSLAVFARGDLPPERRTDRVIAEAWDAAFTLFDGRPSRRDIIKMQKQVPLQEAGRNDSRQLVLSRANRSARAFDDAVDALARGRQPQNSAGYLMRTTAVYGNGKFGIADRARICGRAEFAAPFAAEMLAVYLFRAFPADLVEHMAAARNSNAARFLPETRRGFGIGNSTGLGMAPFLVNHPVLLHQWICARETALARVRSVKHAAPESRRMFLQLIARAENMVAQWQTENGGQQQKNNAVLDGLAKLRRHCKQNVFAGEYPWNVLYAWAEKTLPAEAREFVVSMLLEPHGERVDELAADMAADESFAVDGKTTVGEMRAALLRDCQWIMHEDFSGEESRARFWYASEEKQEPRLGARVDGAERWELPLAVMHDARRFWDDLQGEDAAAPLSLFLLRYPMHRGAAKRAQLAAKFPYGEIRGNLTDGGFLPLDMLRCKLSFFGATHFDPRSDKWLRINMFRHAPEPHELCSLPADDWAWGAH